MFIFKQVEQCKQYLNHQKNLGRTISFVPTMGALHQGHMALIRYAKTISDITVCSIFVNPTQFNDPNDLVAYPNTPVEDRRMLIHESCDVLFAPDVSQVYLEGEAAYQLDVDLGSLTQVLEGEHRPGHFEGMMQVVNRLLEIVEPNYLIMGDKDYQQKTIVDAMIDALKLNVELKTVPIVREADGLARSSRNVRISQEHREIAPKIYEILSGLKEDLLSGSDILESMKKSKNQLKQLGFNVEYLELVDGKDLTTISDIQWVQSAVLLIAAWLGDVRLIDKLTVK